tara:strand:- start:3930 stop:4661 length:732 start_codon:yes stop_codon:yes gene_type:complete
MTKRNNFSRGKSESKAKRKAFEKERAVKQHTNKVHEACTPIVGKTSGQCELIKAIKRSTIIFVTGWPGVGKTYLTSAMAADALESCEIGQVVCTRPIISCGNDIGILPGNVDDKFSPFMQPIMDVFNKRIGTSGVESYVKNGRIKQIPLQLLRGASIDNAWIIADESQNQTVEQLTMLLTRVGEGSKLIINGDIHQKDIKNSGLAYVIGKLKGVAGVEHISLGIEDIVRSGICKDIVIALFDK